ncbi:uncharacterized protein VB005_08380 [Metarhizium brunneum]
MSAPDASTLSVAAFTALGTIVGYLGTEVASSSVFDRMLWASRFFNDSKLKSFIAYAFLMPIGGPIHKAAVEAMGNLHEAGLWKGYCQGDMLGTAFFKDTKHSYVVRGRGGCGPRKEARNAFWVTVLSLVPWQPRVDWPKAHDDREAANQVQKIRAQRPVHLLRLSRENRDSASIPVVNGDIGPMKVRYIIAVLSTELTTLIVGVVTAVVWRSPFSVWYLIPLLLKLTALLCRVRREQLPPPSKEPRDIEPILCQIEDFSKGFFLIEGKSELVLQFFRHYAHPERHRRGILGDRFRELASMATITATALLYPGGLIAFIFAPVAVQWVWLGYQLYAMLAMHMYRFGDGEYLGMTQKCIGEQLYHKTKVFFDDGSGNVVLARLENKTAQSIAEGREYVESLVEQVLMEHAQPEPPVCRTTSTHPARRWTG